MLSGFFKLMQEKEAFVSCKIDGIYPESMTFKEYLILKHDREEKRRKLLKKQNRNKIENSI